MTDELSRSAVEQELYAQRRDLRAFQQSHDLVEGRCFEAQDERFHPILEWQGADAALFVLKSCIDKISGVIQEYGEILEQMDRGEIQDTDKPSLRLVGVEE
jgi:hypothetical protein